MEVWNGIWKKILEWNGIWKKILVWNGIWNGRFLVWNGNGIEENCQYGIRKNRLPFHSIPCPACDSQNTSYHPRIREQELFFFVFKLRKLHPKSRGNSLIFRLVWTIFILQLKRQRRWRL